MSPITPELQQRIAYWRQKSASGEPMSLEECREAVALLREGRLAAAQTAASTRRTKAKAAIPDAQDILDGL